MAVEEKASGVDEVHILWISEGMSCDGDSVSITAAGQPGIEDVVLGAIPGLPKVNLHNKVLSPTLGGEEFLLPFRQADVRAAGVDQRVGIFTQQAVICWLSGQCDSVGVRWQTGESSKCRESGAKESEATNRHEKATDHR